MKAWVAILLGTAAICACLIALLFVGPIVRAHSAYERASAVYDRDEQCASARSLVDGWALAGPLGYADYWAKQAKDDCEQARFNRLERSL